MAVELVCIPAKKLPEQALNGLVVDIRVGGQKVKIDVNEGLEKRSEISLGRN